MEDEYKKWTVTALKKELSGLKVKIPPKTEHDSLIKLLLAEKEATDQTRYVLWWYGGSVRCITHVGDGQKGVFME